MYRYDFKIESCALNTTYMFFQPTEMPPVSPKVSHGRALQDSIRKKRSKFQHFQNNQIYLKETGALN